MQNKYTACGTVLENVGGLYRIRLDSGTGDPLSGKEISCNARGLLRHKDERPKAGDRVNVAYTDHSFSVDDGGAVTPSEGGADIFLSEICLRRNVFIRPPVANLDYLFLVLSSRSPQTLPLVADKMISIAEHSRVEPVIIVSKCDLDIGAADVLFSTYKKAGFEVYRVSSNDGTGIDELSSGIEKMLCGGKIAAFAGASGVGKSTLLNRLFPYLGLQTHSVSRKNERGRHTTRAVTLYPVFGGYLADTPGFSMLDFERFDFFRVDELLDTFRDFAPFSDKCRYADCSHTKEEGCAVIEAVRRGEISQSRHDSYLDMYSVLRLKPSWKK